jgi:hypothetical protein
MEGNYIINNARMLQPNEDGINPVYIQVKEGDKEYDIVIDMNGKGISQVTSDWPYIKMPEEPTDDELDILRCRIVEILNKAGDYIQAQKDLLLKHKCSTN